MSRYDIDFVAFDLAGKGDRRPTVDNPLAQLLDHRPGVILVDIKLLGNLQPGEVQAHQVEARDPGLQRLVVAGEDRPGEVVEPLATATALVTLSVRLGVVPPVLDHRGRGAMGQTIPSGHRSDRTVS